MRCAYIPLFAALYPGYGGVAAKTASVQQPQRQIDRPHVHVWQTADGTPPYWVAYFKYDDVDGGFERARELGGELMDEPNDSQYGRWATVRDPQGAVFRLISTNP